MTIGPCAKQNSVDGRPPENADHSPPIFDPKVFCHDLGLQVNFANQSRIDLGLDELTNVDPSPGLVGDGAGSSIDTSSGRFLDIGVDWRLGGERLFGRGGLFRRWGGSPAAGHPMQAG
ncbi:hypothetical protein [Thermaurantiacus sp.]